MPTRPMSNVIRHVRRIALQQAGTGRSDKLLLDAFLTQKDQLAFEALVHRHGPMVLEVCRRVLRNAHDAEDAFQAAFMVLLRKAHSIGKRDLLANWLYGVAYRTALKARTNAGRRRARERDPKAMPPESAPAQEIPEELLAQLDLELNRLPEKLRAPVVLCDLQGLVRKEAARRLGWPLGTLNWRLARARAVLARKLTRHGLALSAGAVAACLARHATAAAVPALLVAATVKTGIAGNTATGGVISANVASLTEGVVKAMLLTKLKGISVVVLLAAFLGTCASQLHHQTAAAAQSPVGVTLPVQAEDAPPKEEPASAFHGKNFSVHAATPEIARSVEIAAERYRKEKALEWLGKELPPWPERCSIQVEITAGDSSGATTFQFEDDKVAHQNMLLKGSLDRILAAELPHEITHVVLANYFGRPLPRWADEGAAILSSDDLQRKKTERFLRQILASPDRFIPLRRLVSFTDFPKDAAALYAEGYSAVRFLVEAKDRGTFLDFISTANLVGWDEAAERHYGYVNLEAFEKVWVEWVKQQMAKDDKEGSLTDESLVAEGSEDRLLATFFGSGYSEAAHATTKWNSRRDRWVIATQKIDILKDGRVKLAPCWCVVYDPNRFTTYHSDEAILTLEKPISKAAELASARIFAIETPGKMQIGLHRIK